MKSTAVFRVVSMIILCGFSFFRFMRSAGLSGGPGLIILSSHEGANYGTVDLRRARTLISLRRLDLIKHLEMFISSLVRLLPPDTSFVGCFARHRDTFCETGHSGSRLMLISRLIHHRSAVNGELSCDRVSAILGRCGLEIINMKELNGLTYFHSRKPVTELIHK